MQRTARFNSTHPGFVDACAAVMLVLKEPGKELARERLLKSFNPAGSLFISTLCLCEALGVLKRKMLHQEIERGQYFYCCYMLFDHRNHKRLNVEDPDTSTFKPFRDAKELAEKYCLDLSDALQIAGLKNGLFSHFVHESKPVLITVDRGLAAAARSEGLRVWNCKDVETPPD